MILCVETQKIMCYKMRVEYKEFERLLKSAGLSKKEFAELMNMKPAAVTNYSSKPEGVARHLAVVAILCCAMKEQGLDFRRTIGLVPAQHKKGRLKAKQGKLF
jgi:hypothetical protein